MTIEQAINKVDSYKPNSYSQADKVGWLSACDERIKTFIIDTHECGKYIEFAGYNSDTPLNTDLLVSEPFDELYLKWLEAQIDYHNGEMGKYNNSILMYNAAYSAFDKYYNRTHMPKGKNFIYF